MCPTTPRKKRIYHHGMDELSDDNSVDCLEIESSKKTNGKDPYVDSIENQSNIKWEFRNCT